MQIRNLLDQQDPAFCNMLRSLGLGASFVMTSVNNRQRRMLQYAVATRIVIVDVEGDETITISSPSAVTFSVVGKKRCEILGIYSGMKTRVEDGDVRMIQMVKRQDLVGVRSTPLRFFDKKSQIVGCF